MASFLCRVELHNASGQDYEKLHKAMEAAGFSRTTEGVDRMTYHLPHAEYEIESELSTDTVCGLATHTAWQTGKKGGILVSEILSQSFVGLKPVS
ncbi:MAG: DUF2622 domain-containing protein [Gemmataceae bacterium]